MGHEKSAPHIKTILITAGICVATLVLLEQAFRSYYNSMFEEETAAKVLTVPTPQLQKLRAGEQEHLTSGKLPLDRAMRELASRGRENPSLRELGTDLTPVQSTDPMPVWGLLAKDGGATASPSSSAAVPVAADAGILLVAGDAAAAMMATDAAATADDGGKKADARATSPAKEAGTH